MSRIDELPSYLQEEGLTFFLTINKTLDESWSASYQSFQDEEHDSLMIIGFINNAKNLDEVYVRMKAKLERNGYGKQLG